MHKFLLALAAAMVATGMWAVPSAAADTAVQVCSPLDANGQSWPLLIEEGETAPPGSFPFPNSAVGCDAYEGGTVENPDPPSGDAYMVCLAPDANGQSWPFLVEDGEPAPPGSHPFPNTVGGCDAYDVPVTRPKWVPCQHFQAQAAGETRCVWDGKHRARTPGTRVVADVYRSFKITKDGRHVFLRHAKAHAILDRYGF